MSETTPRRSLIVVVAAISLLGAVAVVRAASVWTATGTPLAKPADAQALIQQLQAEQARSADLRKQLDAVAGRAGALSLALQAATQKASADAATAAQLASRLKAAQARPAGLPGQLIALPTTGAAAAATPAPVAPPIGGDDD